MCPFGTQVPGSNGLGWLGGALKLLMLGDAFFKRIMFSKIWGTFAEKDETHDDDNDLIVLFMYSYYIHLTTVMQVICHHFLVPALNL